MTAGRRLPWIPIGAGLVVAGLGVWAAPALFGALELLSADRAEENHTIFFVPEESTGASPLPGMVGVGMAVLGVASIAVGVAVRMRL